MESVCFWMEREVVRICGLLGRVNCNENILHERNLLLMKEKIRKYFL